MIPSPEAASSLDRHGRDGYIGAGLFVGGYHVPEVDAIKLIAGKNQHFIYARLFGVAEVLPHGIGGALVPVGVIEGLLGRQYFHEPAVENVEIVRAADMAVQTDGIELGDHVTTIQTAVDAIRQGNVDQAILARHWNRRFGTVFRERIKPRSLSASQYQCHNVSHAITSIAKQPR